MKQIILASTSPRRRELLTLAGLSFEVASPDCKEETGPLPPEEYVMELAGRKCSAVADKICEDALVIGADTIVYFDGKILGKPVNEEDAFLMLRTLSGQTHEVFTGVMIRDTGAGTVRSFYEKTEVTFYPVSDQEIWDYIATKEPMDKAGAYGIQGRGMFLIEKICGDYNNVVGLPAARLLRVLKELS